MTAALALARALHFAALMVIFGSAALGAVMRFRLPGFIIGGHALLGIRRAAVAVALFSAIFWLCLAAGQMSGDWRNAFDPSILVLTVMRTLFGQVFVARLVLLIALSVTLGGGEIVMTMLSGGALAATALTSHAANSGPPHFGAVGVVIDALHLLMAGFWVGGLCVLLVCFVQRKSISQPGALLGVFSEWAMVAVAILVITGLLNSALILLKNDGAVSELYIVVLGTKLLCVLAMTGLALTNHFYLAPRVTNAGSVAALTRNIILELGFGLAAIVLAAFLGLLMPTI